MARLNSMKRPGEFKWGNYVGILIIVAIGVAIGGFFLIRHVYRSHALSPFATSVQEYVAMRPVGAPMEQPCQGGVIPIDASSGTIDHFYFDMPEKLRAANPEGVKTVVFLRWDRKQTHKYSNGRPGYSSICEVDVVDRETKQFLKKAFFQGPPPPESISGRSSSGEGARPTEQVIHFLQNNIR